MNWNHIIEMTQLHSSHSIIKTMYVKWRENQSVIKILKLLPNTNKLIIIFNMFVSIIKYIWIQFSPFLNRKNRSIISITRITCLKRINQSGAILCAQSYAQTNQMIKKLRIISKLWLNRRLISNAITTELTSNTVKYEKENDYFKCHFNKSDIRRD